MQFPVLIGDIGGTNARFAVIGDALSQPQAFEPVQLAGHATFEAAVEASVLAKTSQWPATMMLAIATPLFGDRFRLTNADWTIDPPAVIDRFDLAELVLMNDFAAQALAALALGPEDMVPIGGGESLDHAPRVVIGPGTGLGIANIVHVGGKWAIIPGEGGHIDLGPRTAREFALWPHLRKEKGRMSAEWAISGRGLENLHAAICACDGADAAGMRAAEVSRAGLSGGDARAAEAVELFLTLLARVAGDMALLTLARGGITIAGGIAAKLLPALEPERFRAAFEDKAPHEAILRDIPVRIMTHPQAALAGLAACVLQPERFSLEGSTRRFEAGR